MKTLLLLYVGDETVTASAGTERVLTNMANAMADKGYDVIVATNDKTDAAPYFLLTLACIVCIWMSIRRKFLLCKSKTGSKSHFSHFRQACRSLPGFSICPQAARPAEGDSIDCIIAYNHEAIGSRTV